MEHSLKRYVDDITLLSDDLAGHKTLLDLRATDIDLCFKPSNAFLLFFDGTKILAQSLKVKPGLLPKGRQSFEESYWHLLKCYLKSCK